MKLYELLDYIWPDNVILNFGEYVGKQYVIKEQITPAQCEQVGITIYEYAEQNRHFPQYSICDIYARGSVIYIDLCPTSVPQTQHGTLSNNK